MLRCASCGAQLEVEDGHELCPKCLGVGHLRGTLSDPFINCSILPLSVREERLRQVCCLEETVSFHPRGTPIKAWFPANSMRNAEAGKAKSTVAQNCKKAREPVASRQ